MMIGNVEIRSRLVLAPIAGFTDAVFRRIAARHGAGLVVTELVSAEGIIRENRKTLELLRFYDDERPVSVQIFGSRVERISEAAKIVEGLSPDIIDINMGCPDADVCKSGSGAALLKDPSAIFNIVKGAVSSVSVPVTVKIRTGWDDSNKNYMDVLGAIEDGGASAIFVHGRTRAQKYTGFADWDVIAQIKQRARIPVIGNGDILTHQGAVARLNGSGCDAVMIGRGALGNPWIFSGRTPSLSEIISQAGDHLSMMMDHYGDKGLILMRKHIVKYIHDLRNASVYRKKLVTAESPEEVYRLLDEFSSME